MTRTRASLQMLRKPIVDKISKFDIDKTIILLEEIESKGLDQKWDHILTYGNPKNTVRLFQSIKEAHNSNESELLHDEMTRYSMMDSEIQTYLDIARREQDELGVDKDWLDETISQASEINRMINDYSNESLNSRPRASLMDTFDKARDKYLEKVNQMEDELTAMMDLEM